MAKRLSILLLLSAMFLSTPRAVLFYDTPEYLSLAREELGSGLVKGHMPIHPGFIFTLHCFIKLTKGWFDSEEYAANILALLLFVFSLYIFFRISKLVLEKEKVFPALLVFAFIPGIYIVGTNLLVESLLLMLFLFGFLMLLLFPAKKAIYAFVGSGILMILTHIQSATWLIVYPVVVYLFKNNSVIKKYSKKIIIGVVFQFLLGLSIYWLILMLAGKTSFEQPFGILKNYFSDILTPLGLARSIRNSLFIHAKSLGVGVLAVLAVLLAGSIKKKNKTVAAGFAVILTLSFLSGLHWMGDFMPRRIVFLFPVAALLSAFYLRKKMLVLLILYQFVVWVSILSFYYKGSFMVESLALMYGREEYKNVITSQYIAPFAKEQFYIERINSEKMNLLLQNGVQIDSYALSSPYYLPAGGNFHITSLKKTKMSNISMNNNVIWDYCFNISDIPRQENIPRPVYLLKPTSSCPGLEERAVLLKDIEKGGYKIVLGRTIPGSVVFIYSSLFKDRLLRERIDYSDPFLWLYSFIFDKKDPVAWGVADKDGVFQIAINGYDGNNFIQTESDMGIDPVVVIE